MSRYTDLFARLDRAGEGAFVPFLMLGDPNESDSLAIAEALIAGGADALELGIPFTDPVADGPTIQDSHIRALDAGVTVDKALALVARIRASHPDIPIGLLVYVNVVFSRGLDGFYADIAKAGVDSLLIPDVPVRESPPFLTMAHHHGIDEVFIAPPNASHATIKAVAERSTGYIYVVSRNGVTGTESAASTKGLSEIVADVDRFGGAPALLGFGISSPEHVREAIAAGARGAISGSAITKIIASHLRGTHPTPRQVDDPAALAEELKAFTVSMKQATRP